MPHGVQKYHRNFERVEEYASRRGWRVPPIPAPTPAPAGGKMRDPPRVGRLVTPSGQISRDGFLGVTLGGEEERWAVDRE